ncbi:MAG: NAD-dependent deacylase [Candidatus Tectomicrobia bacterium]|uniref:protein acetyllysine N-acetyltransferase n=1 Tax=Tectimicrobiota bacterium TaxID=2528274 RepID=A0A932CPU1_UNCTE|nr:NAD-dependent deacylase [Candidatus Tectomicrobia bacterium]
MEPLIEKAARDLARSRYAIALTGAGISTESGIPDFRGPSGVWTRDPAAESRAYRSYERFQEDPKAWWKERLSGPSLLGDVEKARPNPGHYALAELERLGRLQWVITQNVDALHEKAGSQNVLEYHGSLLKLRCTSCIARFRRDEFDLEQLRREDLLPPRCPRCGGLIKTDGVAFGEPIPQDVARKSLEEALRCDLMLICGTSAVVYPFAELPRVARQRKVEAERKARAGVSSEQIPTITIVELNAEPTPLTREKISDYLIQGKTGEILPQIVAEVRRMTGGA